MQEESAGWMGKGTAVANFRKHYLPTCRALERDNGIGKVIFGITTLIQSVRAARKGVLRMTTSEQDSPRRTQRMSDVLWDTFTGSAPYADVFLRSLHPMFLGGFLWETGKGAVTAAETRKGKEDQVTYRDLGELGKIYQSGEIIVRQGETGDCMYFVQSGKVEVIKESEGREVRLAELGEGEFFGEMALFEKDVRSATVRPLGEVRVLSVDKKMFLRKIHDDPSLAFRVMQRMSRRIRELNDELIRLRSEEA